MSEVEWDDRMYIIIKNREIFQDTIYVSYL